MTEIELIRDYLRVDADMDEDDTIQGLIDAGKRYITTSTGKQYKDDDAVMFQCLRLLVTHWYTNRTAYAKSGYTEAPHTISAMMGHIQTSSAYAEVSEDD